VLIMSMSLVLVMYNCCQKSRVTVKLSASLASSSNNSQVLQIPEACYRITVRAIGKPLSQTVTQPTIRSRAYHVRTRQCLTAYMRMVQYKVKANKNITQKDAFDDTVNTCFSLGCWAMCMEGGQNSGVKLTTQRVCL
jgi:hypothetical protein